VLPPTRGPHPVVLVVGEPNATERDYSSWLDGMAEAGFACFTWDRAGVGRPGHDPVRRVADQAREVLAALDRVSLLPELEPDAVALVGWGEGGWAAAQAVTFSSRVRALVLASTPTAPPAVLVEHQLIQRLRAAGHAGSDVATARDVVRRRLRAVLAGQDLAGDDSLEEQRRHEPWYDTLRSVDAFARPEVEQLPPDPIPTLSAVRVPVLALFGEQDPTLPLEESVRGARTALRDAGHEDHRVAVVRGADRLLRVRPGHGLGCMIDGRHQFGEWPSGLTAVVADWLDARIHRQGGLPAFPPPAVPGPTPGRSAGSAARSGAGPGAWREARPLLPVRQVRRRISH
jgi:pimeloyl-ACP methyl ester carboxylesterase